MSKNEKKKSIDFINEPEKMSKFSMNDILGGRAVQAYVNCMNVHHSPATTASARLDVW
jgi:hypothetical protein